jgi:hypothetical protein
MQRKIRKRRELVPISRQLALIREKTSMGNNPSKSRFELMVELVKAVAWPLFASVLLISFWGPLRSAVSQLPNIISRSETLSIAGLSLKIRRGLTQQPSEEVKKSLSKLSPDDLKRLLNFNSTYCGEEYASSCRADYAGLTGLGLIAEVPESELNQQTDERGKRYGFGARITPKGKETQTFLLALISEFVQELERSGEEVSSKE